jgi:hypothetical protein
MRILTFFLAVAAFALTNGAAPWAQSMAPDVGMAWAGQDFTPAPGRADANAGRNLRLAASPIPQGEDAAAAKAGETQSGGACGRSGYTCGSRYPYCCYSENKGYYCRQDAKHC